MKRNRTVASKFASQSEDASVKKARKKYDKETVDAPGFCTDSDLALKQELVDVVITGSADPNHEILMEQDLLGTGRSKKMIHLLKAGDNGDQKKIVYYYSGKRFVKKDRINLISFVEAVKKTRSGYLNAKPYLLLAASSEICKRNAIPDLCDAGVVVQRV